MAPPARRISASNYEAAKAMLSVAGLRQLIQANISAANGADSTYTVQNKATRRVVIVHLNAGNGDLRFNINANATATTVPVLAGRYFVVDCLQNDVLHFFNTTGTSFTVYLVETD